MVFSAILNEGTLDQRGSPTKKAKKATFASLARPTDFGGLGLVLPLLGPLIQGRMRAGLSGTHVQLNGKCRKIVFSSMRSSKFSGKYRVLYIIL